MSDASIGEQSSVGLDRMSVGDFRRLETLNRAYREKFGFPFLFAVKGSTVASILSALERRLEASPEEEFQEALAQVYRIASFRLRDAVHD
jgi:2-oxo-4-hydroxy-4-carboxy-5-ureidoimidazoline decarboxylase